MKIGMGIPRCVAQYTDKCQRFYQIVRFVVEAAAHFLLLSETGKVTALKE
jgi:hypothetical protein